MSEATWLAYVRKPFMAALLVALGGFASLAVARAQVFPDRNIRIVAPAAAGGALDLISRILAQKASELLGRTVLVDNKPGANMIIGMDSIAKANPDGYNLLLVSSSAITVNPYVFQRMPLDPAHDLAPILTTTITPYALLLNPGVPARTVADFIAYLKANPGKLNHASNSAATMLVSELFKALAGVDYVDINYRGASHAINDTIGGQAQFCFVDLGSASTAIKGGTLIPLALTTPDQFEYYPGIPVFVKQGLPTYSVMGRTILAAPGNTPPDIVEALNRLFRNVLASPDVGERLRGMGQIIGGGAPAETVDILRAEAAQWETLVRERHIHFDP